MSADTLTDEERELIDRRVAELMAEAPPLSEEQEQFARTLGRSLTARRAAA